VVASFQDQLFLDALDTLDRQVGEVTQFWFVTETVNEGARTNRYAMRCAPK
jgi:hypothetical protein